MSTTAVRGYRATPLMVIVHSMSSWSMRALKAASPGIPAGKHCFCLRVYNLIHPWIRAGLASEIGQQPSIGQRYAWFLLLLLSCVCLRNWTSGHCHYWQNDDITPLISIGSYYFFCRNQSLQRIKPWSFMALMIWSGCDGLTDAVPLSWSSEWRVRYLVAYGECCVFHKISVRRLDFC